MNTTGKKSMQLLIMNGTIVFVFVIHMMFVCLEFTGVSHDITYCLFSWILTWHYFHLSTFWGPAYILDSVYSFMNGKHGVILNERTNWLRKYIQFWKFINYSEQKEVRRFDISFLWLWHYVVLKWQCMNGGFLFYRQVTKIAETLVFNIMLTPCFLNI